MQKIPTIIAVIFGLLVLFYYYSSYLRQPTIQITTSDIDNREYKIITLPNDIKVLLISDHEKEQAAVSLNVGVGSYSEPDYLPGLAHFLEHMLFMGSEKFPDVDEFPNLIALNTGAFNAYT